MLKIPISLNVKFILINIIGIIIIGFGISRAFLHYTTIEGKINDFNGAFVDAQKFVNKNNNECEDYLNSVAENHNVNAVVMDENGKVLMKSNNVKEDKFDMEKLGEWFHERYDDGNFYQQYYIAIDNQTEKLLIWNSKSNIYTPKIIIGILSTSVAVAMLLIYILTNRKVKYIKTIAKGAVEFSSGNLDYRIEKKGNDELGFLAQSMNDMAVKLKENIEKERAQEKFKTELITNVSHDLRTPLTSLIAYIQLVENEKTTEYNKKKYTAISIEKAYKLKQLIEDLFEYSKLESGEIYLNKSEVNVVEILEQSIGELFMESQKRNITLKKEFETSKAILNVDSIKLGRVFQNLLSNAVKYGIEGTDIYVDLIESNECVTVLFENKVASDSLEDTLNLFDRFYRSDKSRNSKVSGSGLGLAISKSIVELHKGEIWAECENNVFKIYVRIYK
jgi:signal transduction histidine kinase